MNIPDNVFLRVRLDPSMDSRQAGTAVRFEFITYVQGEKRPMMHFWVWAYADKSVYVPDLFRKWDKHLYYLERGN